VSSVPFTSGTEGYTCFTIPALLRTASGALLAISEARRGVCGDFDPTELVYKRSVDGGSTWGPLTRLVEPQGDASKLGVCGHSLVIGNVAPVQLGSGSSRHPGRILAPHTRNNFEVWITYSDDDGQTWSTAARVPNVTLTAAQPDCYRNMSYFDEAGVDTLRLGHLESFSRWLEQLCRPRADPYGNATWTQKLSGPWQFVGVGPPGALQLGVGRVLVPAYHSYMRGLDGSNGTLPVSQLYNNFALGHTLISDDDGDTWRLGWTGSPLGEGANENQMVQLPNGSVLMNARSLSTGSPQHRVQARSDDGGETFGPSRIVPELPQPFNGCQGSFVGGDASVVYVAGPDPPKSTDVLQEALDYMGCRDIQMTGRSHVTVWKSIDGGGSYPRKLLIDSGLSAQTSLQHHRGQLSLLYEQADPSPDTVENEVLQAMINDLKVLLPDRFVYRSVDGI
jgi:sialidase-1